MKQVQQLMMIIVIIVVSKVIMMNIMMMKMKQIEYSAFKNSLAPYILTHLPMISCLRARGECSLDDLRGV